MPGEYICDNGESSNIAKISTNLNEDRPLRICIVGGGGYLGQMLTKDLQQLGHFVVILDVQFQSFPHISVNTLNLLTIQGSVLDEYKLEMALLNCDACFHLAGYGMSGGASLNRKMNMLINYEGTKRVIDACRRAAVTRLIYSSSISVVYRGEEMHFSEESEPYAENFANAYAESKCLAERLLLGFNGTPICSGDSESASGKKKLFTCALRFRGIYGPGELRSTDRTVALMLAEKSLRRGGDSPAAGKAYNIVDGGPPVDTFEFWTPLMESLGQTPPAVEAPYPLVYLTALLMEWLYHFFGVEPIFTRFEVELMAKENTFSIDRARRDIGYFPVNNHDLTATIAFYRKHAATEVLQKANIVVGKSDSDINQRKCVGVKQLWNSLNCWTSTAEPSTFAVSALLFFSALVFYFLLFNPLYFFLCTFL